MKQLVDLSQCSDNTTGNSTTSISSLLGVGVIGSTKVVCLCVKYHCPGEDTMGTGKRNEAVVYINLADVVFVEHHVAKVADVAVRVSWMTMVFMFRVVVGAGRQTSSSSVSFLMYMESVVALRKTSDGTLDVHLPVSPLGERDVPLDTVAN